MERSVWTSNEEGKRSQRKCKYMDDNFLKFLKLTNKERELNPNVLVAYKRPQTIATLLTNYKIQAHEDSVAIGESHPFRKGLLCNQGGEGEMVKKN